MIRLYTRQHINWIRITSAILLFGMLAGCTLAPSTPAPSPAPTLVPGDQDLSADEIATLSSLTQLDDFPLYTLHYAGAYPPPTLIGVSIPQAGNITPNTCQAGWGCSLFAALGDPGSSALWAQL